MTKGAGLVPVYRKLLIVQHCLAEQFDLLDLIARRSGETLERLRLDAVDLVLDLGDLAESGRR